MGGGLAAALGPLEPGMSRSYRRSGAFDDVRNTLDKRDRFAMRDASRGVKARRLAEVEQDARGEFVGAPRHGRKWRKGLDGAASF